MFLVSLSLWCDEVSVKGDVNIHIVAVNGILTLAFVETDPDLVALLQRQHDALALHDGAVAGLSVNDGLLAVVLHDVQVRLLEVPRMDVHIEEVDSRNEAEVLPSKHVEVFGGVDEDGVKDQGLVVVNAVKGFPSADRESRMLGLAGVTWSAGLSLISFKAFRPSWSWGTLNPRLPGSSSFSTVTLVTLKRCQKCQKDVEGKRGLK